MNNSTEIHKAGAVACATLIEKAWENPVFKDELIDNPTVAFESVLGVKFSPNYKLVVEDQSDDSIIYLNIPAQPNIDELELSDEQLELVAGGEGAVVLGAATVVAVGAVAAVCVVGFVAAVAVGYCVNREW